MSTNIFEYKGYSLVQTPYNCHYRVFNDKGHMVVHVPAERMFSESEAHEAIDRYIRLNDMVCEVVNHG